MNGRYRNSKQGELFPPEQPPHLITNERHEALIPLLSMVIAVAMEVPDPVPEGAARRGAGHEG